MTSNFVPKAKDQQRRITSSVSFEPPKKVKKAKEAFRTISEVANKLDVQQHVLRFWETKFSQVRPMKRGGGRRYYRPEDVALLERIHHLLYTEGYTIKGVQKLLKEQGKAQVIAQADNQNAAPTPKVPKPQAPEQKGLTSQQRAVFEALLVELKAMRALLKV
jgi:DNA-binding transcriptional MerR regulator